MIKAEDYHFEFLSHSSGQPENDDDPFLYAEIHMPSYVGFECTADFAEQRKIYPTKSMIKGLLDEMNRRIYEIMGIDINNM